MPKAKKINTAPKGISFMYEPRTTTPERTRCPQCVKNRVRKPGYTRLHGTFMQGYFDCTRRDCNWTTAPSGKKRERFVPKTLAEIRGEIDPKPRKKHRADSTKLVDAIRAECVRRDEIIRVERAAFPPTLTKKGKRLVRNPRFTAAMRAHMHLFAFSSEDVRRELRAEGLR